MTIQYNVSMDPPEKHYFHVEMIVPLSSGIRQNDKLRLLMPVWTPGSYLVREFARNVLDLRAYDAKSGEKIECYKDTKNSWVVKTPESVPVVKIDYNVYAFEYTVDTSYLDNRHGIINGASVFMYAEGRERENIQLTITPYKDWKVISTSLDRLESSTPKTSVASSTFHADNFDILVDSPIEIGNQELHTFNVEGIRHDVSIFGPKPIESDVFVSDLKKIVEATWKIFNVIPYKRYLFLVDFSGADQNSKGGGLEHLSSTHCIAPRLRMIPSQEYSRMLSLFSHEFFHAWNVKRMRPKGLGPFDYSSETYTKSLWIAEGITSYYDDLIVRRSGIYSVADFLDVFCINVDQLRFFPAPEYQSAEEASFDAWIKYYRPNENTPNVQSSYYYQGAVIGWMLDMAIRKTSKSSKTLDDAMRLLYERTFVKENRGYTSDEFEEICNEICDKDLSREIFDKRVRGHERVDFDRYLGYAGLELSAKKKPLLPRGYLGIKIRTDGGKAIVASKLFSTPAEECGLAAGDEIIAVDNLRIDGPTLQFYIGNKQPGTKVSLLISRDGYLETHEATLIETPQIESRIYKKEKASNEEKARFKHWMLQAWDEPLVYSDYVASPQKPKLFDYF
jgi:predicted metalloprotease with PDZ domain